MFLCACDGTCETEFGRTRFTLATGSSVRACVRMEKEEDGGPALVKPFPGDKAMGQLVHAGCCCSFLLVLPLW